MRSTVNVLSPTASVAKRVPLNVSTEVRSRLARPPLSSRCVVIVPRSGHESRAHGFGTTTSATAVEETRRTSNNEPSGARTESCRELAPLPFHAREASSPARPLSTSARSSSTTELGPRVVAPLRCDWNRIEAVAIES